MCDVLDRNVSAAVEKKKHIYRYVYYSKYAGEQHSLQGIEYVCCSVCVAVCVAVCVCCMCVLHYVRCSVSCTHLMRQRASNPRFKNKTTTQSQNAGCIEGKLSKEPKKNKKKRRHIMQDRLEGKLSGAKP